MCSIQDRLYAQDSTLSIYLKSKIIRQNLLQNAYQINKNL